MAEPEHRGRFRVKLIVPSARVVTPVDVHYFYADTLEGAEEIADTLRAEVDMVPVSVCVYVETSLGHVRVS